MSVGDQKYWDNISFTTTSSCTDNTTDWNYTIYPYYGDPYYTGDPPADMAPYIGDPISIPSTTPDYSWQPSVWYPVSEKEKIDSDKIKELVEEALKEAKKTKKEANMMKVFDVIVVDKKECEILDEKKIIAKDSETAMLELDLTPEIRKRVKKNQIEFIFRELGQFKRLERKIKVEEESDED